MSYNVLADSLVENTDYGVLNPDYMKWPLRRLQIIKEITQLKPDIVAF